MEHKYDLYGGKATKTCACLVNSPGFFLTSQGLLNI